MEIFNATSVTVKIETIRVVRVKDKTCIALSFLCSAFFETKLK